MNCKHLNAQKITHFIFYTGEAKKKQVNFIEGFPMWSDLSKHEGIIPHILLFVENRTWLARWARCKSCRVVYQCNSCGIPFRLFKFSKVCDTAASCVISRRYRWGSSRFSSVLWCQHRQNENISGWLYLVSVSISTGIGRDGDRNWYRPRSI